MGTPEKHTPQLSESSYLNVRFADKNSKSLLNMLMSNINFTYLYEIGTFIKLVSNCPHISTAHLFYD